METKYASAERSPYADLLKSNLSLEKIEFLNDIFCSISFIFCILNENRQIVFSNDILMKTLEIKNVDQILGKRFGEAINCRFAFEEEGGCGTTEHCRYCGAVNAMLQCQITGLKTVSECRVRRMVNGVESFLDVEVTATPFLHENASYTIFSLVDITDRKRRAIIENIFLHDIMNAAMGIRGFFEVFGTIDEEELNSFIEIGSSLSQQIIDEISMQKLLISAEKNELRVTIQPLETLDFLNQVISTVQFLKVAREKQIVIDSSSVRTTFESDPTLLRRVLNNMIKNALEASVAGETVTLAAHREGSRLRFSVHNTRFIPKEVEMQVFMRSFSTKGAQRGIGTYSMKVLGEQYLKGNVGFTTTEEGGTTFYIVL